MTAVALPETRGAMMAVDCSVAVVVVLTTPVPPVNLHDVASRKLMPKIVTRPPDEGRAAGTIDEMTGSA
jgi:hypothetical protein